MAATPKGEPELLEIADEVYEIRSGKLAKVKSKKT